MIKLVTITGPSCTGKTTLAHKLIETGKFCSIVSFTTRPKRAGEIHGKDYYFITQKAADTLLEEDAAIGCVEFKGFTYGIEKREIEDKLTTTKIPVTILEPKGIEEIKKAYGRSVFPVYVNNSPEVLIERYLERFRADILEGAYVEDATGLIRTNVSTRYHAVRAAGMLAEHSTWDRTNIWEFYIGRFDKENSTTTILRLIKAIEDKQKNFDFALKNHSGYM